MFKLARTKELLRTKPPSIQLNEISSFLRDVHHLLWINLFQHREIRSIVSKRGQKILLTVHENRCKISCLKEVRQYVTL